MGPLSNKTAWEAWVEVSRLCLLLLHTLMPLYKKGREAFEFSQLVCVIGWRAYSNSGAGAVAGSMRGPIVHFGDSRAFVCRDFLWAKNKRNLNRYPLLPTHTSETKKQSERGEGKREKEDTVSCHKYFIQKHPPPSDAAAVSLIRFFPVPLFLPKEIWPVPQWSMILRSNLRDCMEATQSQFWSMLCRSKSAAHAWQLVYFYCFLSPTTAKRLYMFPRPTFSTELALNWQSGFWNEVLQWSYAWVLEPLYQCGLCLSNFSKSFVSHPPHLTLFPSFFPQSRHRAPCTTPTLDNSRDVEPCASPQYYFNTILFYHN